MKNTLVKTYLKKYFTICEVRKRLNEKTLKAYRIDLNQFFSFMKDDLEDIKRINDYITELNQNYPKPKTVKRKIASIKAFYAYLEYEEIIEVSPFRKIRTSFREPLLLPKTIPSKYISEIFECIYLDIEKAETSYQKKNSIRNAAIIELLFATGIRISELCNIKIEDIDFNEKTLKIFGKGSKERMLYLGNEEVIQILQRYKDINLDATHESGSFFMNKFKEKLSEQSVRILLINLERRIGSNIHITPHMFRHTFATKLLEKDVDIRYIQKILGHSSISITQIYTHVTSSKQKEILTLKNPRNDFSMIQK